MGKSKHKVYAVAKGRTVGIFNTWEECKKSVHQFTGARFKSFASRDLAQDYLAATTSLLAAIPSHTDTTKRKAEDTIADEPEAKNATRVIENPYRKKIKTEVETKAASSFVKVHIMFDGGARGNPGIAGSGAMVVLSTSNTDNETRHIRWYVGNNSTNNVAEYSGLVYGLVMAKEMLHARNETSGKLFIQGDSNLIIQQLNGVYKVKNAKLKPLFQQVQRLLQELKALGIQNQSFEHVYRSGNKVADGTSIYVNISIRILILKCVALANEAMDAQRSWFTTSTDGHKEQFTVLGICTGKMN